ncbi:hypothetical protein [Solidesulfovibrio carbinolicus]|uniref:DUF4148 domain-containing protein n=1 Tax=Solidesulfovibrio carbinolicus TaxID=296842 RepID=A0A4P6HN21_9BACT|nr:hypothetical protein [Solidesulfovibrio carbinolicus]QAZ68136.1 hypothetical protein C3Y92_13230 [Solidesulfovibrio carbinolicus]
MKRLLLIAAIAVLGATVYVADPPRLTAKETAAAGIVAKTPAVQSEVVRLAEASLLLRRQGEPRLAAYDQHAEPHPQRLFQSK